MSDGNTGREITEAEAKALKEVEVRFTYHEPKPGQIDTYQRIRAMAKDLAEAIVLRTPVSREQSVALTKLDEVVMFANAAVARRS